MHQAHVEQLNLAHVLLHGKHFYVWATKTIPWAIVQYIQKINSVNNSHDTNIASLALNSILTSYQNSHSNHITILSCTIY